MDFQDQIGKLLRLQVTSFTPPRRPSKEVISFGIEPQDLDRLLFDARTPQEQARDEADMERWLDIDYVPFDRLLRRTVDPRYGSLRVYHLSVNFREELRVGDAWAVEVTKCYLNPNEARTKDGRRKIHFTVRPVRRIETVQVSCDFEASIITTRRFCGINHDVEKTAFDARQAMYRQNGLVIRALVAFVDGKPTEHYSLQKVEFLLEIGKRQADMLGGAFNRARFAREYAMVPAPPQALLELAHKMVGRTVV